MIEDFGSRKKILVAPLNWGLGHATRCIPIIRNLVSAGHEVHLGSDGVALALLREEFPNLSYIELPGYRIHYRGRSLIRSLILQTPKLLKAIIAEKRAVSEYVSRGQIDIIISDNRLGARTSHTRNIVMTHQLTLLLPHPLMSRIATRLNQAWLRKFDAIWVPDSPPPDNLSGLMSTAGTLPNVRYIGTLTRLHPCNEVPVRDFVAVLSGPEPARTELERLIITQFRDLSYSLLLVRGLPGIEIPFSDMPDHIETVTYLTSEHMNEAICTSRYVITRSGYTSVMDLSILGKSAILIPTPGQPEQEYLGVRLTDHDCFVVGSQKGLNLESLISALKSKEDA
ncbi:MAG TPA: glycosyltransferase [Saprospiraceae bacterium]|nr:glycosyltransferase [Saprospiraceae bacterium]